MININSGVNYVYLTINENVTTLYPNYYMKIKNYDRGFEYGWVLDQVSSNDRYNLFNICLTGITGIEDGQYEYKVYGATGSTYSSNDILETGRMTITTFNNLEKYTTKVQGTGFKINKVKL